MPTLSIPVGATFTVINVNTIEYAGTKYVVDGSLTFPDGTKKTLNDLIVENGGAAYAEGELKRCFKVEGLDQDANGELWFTVYSNNSKQTGKNEVSKVPGGMWCDWCDFSGTVRADGGYDNPLLGMWQAFGKTAADWDPAWIGFHLSYGVSDTRAYVATYQDDFLQESVPSNPVTIDATFMHSVQLHGVYKPQAPDPGGHYYVPIRKIRLWRTVVGTDGSTSYRLVPADAISDGYNSEGEVREFNHEPGKFTQQIPDSSKSYGYMFKDVYRDEDLLTETLESTDWDPPPFRSVLQLTNMWNGMMAVHQGNTILICEPYRPHAWPAKYRYPLPYDVVSKEVDGNTMIVVTTGPAYIFMGAHPSAMTFEPLPNTQAGVKSEYTVAGPTVEGIRCPSRAVCRTPAGVCYATEEGLVIAGQGQSKLITSGLFTKEEWLSRYGTKLGRLRLAFANGRIKGWFNRSSDVGFVMDLAGTMLTQWSLPLPIGVARQLPGSNGLYMLAANGGTTTTLQRDEDPNVNRMPATWISRKVIMPKPSNFGVCQVVGSGSVTVTVTAGSRQALANQVLTLTDGVPQQIRMPAGFLEREWSVILGLNANAVVREFYLAAHPEELRSA